MSDKAKKPEEEEFELTDDILPEKMNEVNGTERRLDYAILHRQLENYIIECLADPEKRGFPTQQEMADKFGVTQRTIANHMREMTFENYRPMLQQFTGKILTRFAAKLIAKPSGFDVLTWMKIVEQWQEGGESTGSGSVVIVNDIPD